MVVEPVKTPHMAAAIMSVDWGWLRGMRKQNKPEPDAGKAIAAVNLTLPFLSLTGHMSRSRGASGRAPERAEAWRGARRTHGGGL
jgi:hypothetical protein